MLRISSARRYGIAVGGVAWDYLQYVEGFRRLGCDVFYVEDTGQWFYDPAAGTFVIDAAHGARYLADALRAIAPGFGDAWSVRAPDGTVHGKDMDAVRRVWAPPTASRWTPPARSSTSTNPCSARSGPSTSRRMAR